MERQRASLPLPPSSQSGNSEWRGEERKGEERRRGEESTRTSYLFRFSRSARVGRLCSRLRVSETGGHARAGYRKCKYPTLSALTYVPAASLRMKLIIHWNRFSCSTEARNSADGRRTRKNLDESLFFFISISPFLDINNIYIYIYNVRLDQSFDERIILPKIHNPRRLNRAPKRDKKRERKREKSASFLR